MTNNLFEKFKRQQAMYLANPKAFEYACAAKSYRDWLEAKGYNVKCQHFTVSLIGDFFCDLKKPLILCNGRCIHKTDNL